MVNLIQYLPRGSLEVLQALMMRIRARGVRELAVQLFKRFLEVFGTHNRRISLTAPSRNH